MKMKILYHRLKYIYIIFNKIYIIYYILIHDIIIIYFYNLVLLMFEII